MANARLSRQQVEVIGRLATNLRVGGQAIMVAGDAQNGKLRVLGLSLEYLTKILPEEADNDINIQQTIDMSAIYSREISSNLSMVSDISLAGSTYNKTPEDTLGLDQSIQLSVTRQLSAESTLVLQSEGFILHTTESLIGLDQSAQYSITRNLSVSNLLSLDQIIDTNQHMVDVESDLTGLTSEVIIQQTFNKLADNTLTLDHNTTVELSKPTASTIGISQAVQISRTTFPVIGSLLNLQQVSFAPSHPFVSNVIGIDHSIIIQKTLNRSFAHNIGVSQNNIRTGTTNAGTFNILTGWSWEWNSETQKYDIIWVQMNSTVSSEHTIGERPIYLSASNQLSLGQSISYTAIFNRSLVTTLPIKHTLGYQYVQNTTFCDYAPSVGSTTDPNNPTPPSMTPPTIEPELYDGVELSYPSIGPTEVINLRGPELGNVNRLNTQRVNRETRGGTLTIFHIPGWPKTKQMRFAFTGLTEQEGQDVLDFVEISVGKEVKLRDWEGRNWYGVITSTEEPIIRNRDGCNLTTDLEFELTSGT